MTTDELCDWFARNRQIPIGDERMDYLFAHVCLRIFQAAGVKKSRSPSPPGPEDWKLSDFLVFAKHDPQEEMTPLQFMRSRFGSRVVKREKTVH